MQTSLKREAIQELLHEGKTGKALEEIFLAISELDDPQEISALWALRAWAHYMREEDDEAWEAIAAAGPHNVEAVECKAHLAADEGDEELLIQIDEEFPGNILVTSAIVACGLGGDSLLRHDTAMFFFFEFSDSDGPSDIKYTNLIKNLGKFFYVKNRNEEDHMIALGFLDLALARYGIGNKNLHHRAEILDWKSRIVEHASGPRDAFIHATGAVTLWECQMELDPGNPTWEAGLNNARICLSKLS